jgi:hypothetical protein
MRLVQSSHARKKESDVENKQGHSKDNQRLMIALPPRQRTDKKRHAENPVECEVGRIRQLVIQHHGFAHACDDNREREREEPPAVCVEVLF